MNSAIGIVLAMVKVPHGLCASAFTTAMPSPASVAVMTNRMAMEAETPATGPTSFFGDLRQRAAVVPHRGHQHHEVLHRAGEDRADQDPERAGQVAELRREHRPDQRTGPRDRREMVAEQHPLVRGVEIAPVGARDRRRRPAVVEREDFGGEERAVETIGQDIRARRGDHQPQRVDLFARTDQPRDHRIRERAAEGDRRPENDLHRSHRACSLFPVRQRRPRRPFPRHALHYPQYQRARGEASRAGALDTLRATA